MREDEVGRPQLLYGHANLVAVQQNGVGAALSPESEGDAAAGAVAIQVVVSQAQPLVQRGAVNVEGRVQGQGREQI